MRTDDPERVAGYLMFSRLSTFELESGEAHIAAEARNKHFKTFLIETSWLPLLRVLYVLYPGNQKIKNTLLVSICKITKAKDIFLWQWNLNLAVLPQRN